MWDGGREREGRRFTGGREERKEGGVSAVSTILTKHHNSTAELGVVACSCCITDVEGLLEYLRFVD